MCRSARGPPATGAGAGERRESTPKDSPPSPQKLNSLLVLFVLGFHPIPRLVSNGASPSSRRLPRLSHFHLERPPFHHRSHCTITIVPLHLRVILYYHLTSPSSRSLLALINHFSTLCCFTWIRFCSQLLFYRPSSYCTARISGSAEHSLLPLLPHLGLFRPRLFSLNNIQSFVSIRCRPPSVNIPFLFYPQSQLARRQVLLGNCGCFVWEGEKDNFNSCIAATTYIYRTCLLPAVSFNNWTRC